MDPNQWSVLNAILALTDEEKFQKEQEQIRLKKMNFKKQLELQRNEILSNRNNDSNSKTQDMIKNKIDFANYENDMKNNINNKISNHHKEKVSIESQIEVRRLQREREREAKIMQEHADIAR